MAHPLSTLAGFILVGALTWSSQIELLAANHRTRLATPDDDALYLPDGRALHALTMGHDRVLADLLWFKTVSYFGKHYATDKNYVWLFHMCDLVTTLSPRATHVYTFGATMLAWEAHAPEQAMRLLDKAILTITDDWYLYYLRGFTAMFFLHDHGRAKEDFLKAAKLPNAHVIVQRLAARELTQGDDPQEAVLLLQDLLRQATDPIVQRALRERLEEARAAARQSRGPR